MGSMEWESLTWDDLVEWAGSRSVSRGRSYQRKGQVQDLAISKDGRLIGTVIGGHRYITSVWLPLQSKCTCPVGYDGCKHAVAAVAEYLRLLGSDEEIHSADADDPRWKTLEAYDDGYEDEGDRDAQPGPNHGDRKIREHIQAKSREELADLVCGLIERFPELREEFRERISLAEGDVGGLVSQARRELKRIVSQEAWHNDGTGEGNLPDYSGLRHRLEGLVELGQADAVAQLGQEIIQDGLEQVGRSHDEGETAQELAECLPVVFKAVTDSRLTPVQKLLFAIHARLQDDYGVIGGSADVVLNGRYLPSDWSDVADDLGRRLTEGDQNHGDNEWSRNYQRDQISDWLIKALNKAGRTSEILSIYEREARKTCSYERLVQYLNEKRQYDDARSWAAEGIKKTAKSLPGIAANLAEQMRVVAESHRHWDIAAAHAACSFLERPNRDGFARLIAAADKAGCQEQVKRLALQFLETGADPVTDADWPLPTPGYMLPLLQPDKKPHYDVLIDLAIADKRPNDVLRWYDKMCSGEKRQADGFPWSGPGTHADRVAAAVAESHPQRALDIYQLRVNHHIKHANVNEYEIVASYLRKMKPIMKSMERERDWKQLITDIRLGYRNRPRFMEILDRLEGKPISGKRKTGISKHGA